MSAILYGILEGFQQSVCDILNVDPMFASARTLPSGAIVTITALPEHLGDIANKIQNQINQIGLGVVVKACAAKVADEAEEPGPFFGDIRLLVGIRENVTINRGTDATPTSPAKLSDGGTLITACAVAERVLTLLHLSVPGPYYNVLRCVDPAMTPVETDKHVGYNLWFATQGGLEYDTPQFDPLAFSQATGFVAVAPATSSSTAVPGTAVFYTTDGSQPGPRNGSLYTAPVAVSTGTKVSAKPYLAGYISGPATTYTAS